MYTTFINDNAKGNIREAGENCLRSRSADFSFFMEFGTVESLEDLRDELRRGSHSFGEIRDALRQYDEVGNFYDYGLAFDYVELGTFGDQTEDYFRFQLSWGGPSDEVRFYDDGTIEYVYLDWFSGVGFNVSREKGFQWLANWFESCDSMNFERERENTGYYDKLAEMESEDDDESGEDNA